MIKLEDIIEDKNLDISLENLLSKRDSCGYDGIMISNFKEYWNLNKDNICKTLLCGKYKPGIVQNQEISTYKGKRRVISKLICTDRLILRAIKQILEKEYEHIFSPNSFAYQEGKGLYKEIEQIAKFANEDLTWVLECDINKYFDNIPIEPLLKILSKVITDDRVINLIKKFLYCKIEIDYNRIVDKNIGIVQGSPISPLLSNIYLNELDEILDKSSIKFCRFGDDLRLFFYSREDATDYLEKLKTYISELKLTINSDKTGIYPILSREYFGYELYKDGKYIYSRRKTNNNIKVYRYWHKDAVKKIGQNYHIVNDGILSKHDFTILFENKDGKKYLPVETVNTLGIYSNIIMSSGFFEFVNKKRVNISMFDKYGNYIGAFISSANGSNAKTMLKQATVYNDEVRRIALAKTLLMAALHNIRSNLKYYKKHNQDDFIVSSIKSLGEYIKQINEAADISQILMIEARARQKYYENFSHIINDNDFLFTKRTKRPPKDEINSLISFGNVFLYNRISTEIHKTSLDIRIGILHSTNKRSETLNLDISEIFKPIIVDRVIFTLINKKMIDKKLHFEMSNDSGVFLNKEGKIVFIRSLEDKLYQRITVNGKQVYYHTLIRDEINKLLRMYLYDEKYKPYKYY